MRGLVHLNCYGCASDNALETVWSIEIFPKPILFKEIYSRLELTHFGKRAKWSVLFCCGCRAIEGWPDSMVDYLRRGRLTAGERGKDAGLRAK